MKIIHLPKFRRQYQRLPENVQELAEDKEKIFRVNPFDSRLKTHKLKGPLQDFWAFSIDYKYRVIFDFVDENTVRFYSVGDHNIYA